MSKTPPIAEWIAVDWGTTNLRAFAMRGGEAVASAGSERGMAGLARDEFEPALLSLVEPWLAADRQTEIVCCGMVGSRQGWVEAGYERVPGPPRRDSPMARATVRDTRLEVHVLHGLKQLGPADVMRGEETQIAGFLSREPGFAGSLCLPGTHSKWAAVSDGRVEDFNTYMTGELFALMSERSILRHTISEGPWSKDAFRRGVGDALDAPASISARLFGLRAAALLGEIGPADARARLSGLLTGLELADAQPRWRDRPVVLLGAQSRSTLYADALSVAGVTARIVDGTEMTLAGLVSAHRSLHDQKVTS